MQYLAVRLYCLRYCRLAIDLMEQALSLTRTLGEKQHGALTIKTRKESQMSRLELFGQGLVGGLMILLFIEYFAGYLHINKSEANRYKKTPEGRVAHVVQNSLLMILLVLCGIASVLIGG